jgi:hypothetical protein
MKPYSLEFRYSSQAVGFKGILFEKISVRTRDGKTYSSLVIGIVADFSIKEDLKNFCRERNGTWHPVKKYWYFPIASKPNNEVIKKTWESCKTIIDKFGEFIICGGCINLSVNLAISEKQKKAFQERILGLQKIDNERIRLDSAWEKEPDLFDIHWVDDFDEEYSHEFRGNEGWLQGTARLNNGKLQQVIVYEEKPEPDADDIWKDIDYPRQFTGEDQNSYWCVPFSQDGSFGWDDEELKELNIPVNQLDEVKDDIEDAHEIFEDPKVKPDCTIKLVKNKQGEPLGFRVQFHGSWAFDRVLGVFKNRVDGRKWNSAVKSWDVPLSSAKDLEEFATKFFKDMVVEASHEANVMLNLTESK